MNGRDPGKAPDPAPIRRDADPSAVTGPVIPAPAAADPAVVVKSPWLDVRADAERGRAGAPAKARGHRVSAVLRRFGRIAPGDRFRLYPPLGASWMPWVAGALAIGWLVPTALHPVGVQDQAIVATAGAWGPTLGPGLALSWPWPIGSARVVDVTTVRHLAVPAPDGRSGGAEHLVLTRDQALIDIACDVRWHIRDLRENALALADPDALLRLAARDALRAGVADMDFAAIAGPGRDALALAVGRRLQDALDRAHAGIVIDGVDIRRAEPPRQIAPSLHAIAAARSDAATEAMQAQSWSRQLVTNAQGETGAFDRIREQYHRAPAVIRRQMYYATMERVLAHSDTVIVNAPASHDRHH